MKVILMNDGGYVGLESVNFPVEVEGELSTSWLVSVETDELVRVGGNPERLGYDFLKFPFSVVNGEVKLKSGENTMKVLLLNNGDFAGMESVNFPVEVEAVKHRSRDFVCVSTEELVRVGANGKEFSELPYWSFRIGTEVEVLEGEL